MGFWDFNKIKCKLCKELTDRQFMVKLANKQEVCGLCYVLSKKELEDANDSETGLEEYIDAKLLINELVDEK